MAKILILGAGFGGLEAATGLAAALPAGYDITLVDRSDSFFVGFTKIDVLLGRRAEADVRSRYSELAIAGVRFVQADITAIDTEARSVATSAGDFTYDYLVIALGCDLAPEATPGFVESGGHHFYSMAGATKLRPVLEQFTAGTIVLGILGTPYKCPPAPYEALFLLHEQLIARGVRDAIQLTVAMPTPRPTSGPAVSQGIEDLSADRDIRLVRSSPITALDAMEQKVRLKGGALDYDLFIGVPVHVPPTVISESTFGGFITPDPVTLETSITNVYAVGDVTKVPVGDIAVPKAGAFAEDGARTVVADILRKEGITVDAVPFHAVGSCYFEVGGGEVAKVNANFLGGPTWRQDLVGPGAEYLEHKTEFETSRRARWFKDKL